MQRHTLRSRYFRSLGLAAIGVCAGAMQGSAAADDPTGAHYEMGRGLEVPALHLTLSGYGALRARNLQDHDARVDLRDLSLFALWQPLPRWQVFGEFEAEHLFVADDRGLTGSDIEVIVERLYIDFAASEALTVRVGRYLTPFGRWNLVHADPLVWTVTRPLVTQIAIPDHASGAALIGSLAVGPNSLEYIVYLDDSADLDPVNGEAEFEDLDVDGLANDFRHAGGAQLRYHFFDDRAEVATSVATFDMTDGGGQRVAAGLDGLLRLNRVELSGELAFRANGRRVEDDDVGGFAQAVVRIAGQVYAVCRSEYYHSGVIDRDAFRATLGLSWRPLPPLNLKLEYSAGDDPALVPDGVQMSFSMLF